MRARLIFALLILTSCGELKTPTEPTGGGDPIDPTATFTRVQAEVFTPTCATAGCHSTVGTQSNLVLTPARSYAAIVGVASVEMPQVLRVAPGDPAGSYLYRKLTGTNITGDRMPQGLPPLPADKLKLVRDWIRRGAPND
jgi:hypothetical protein